jgi:hypothetical protein
MTEFVQGKLLGMLPAAGSRPGYRFTGLPLSLAAENDFDVVLMRDTRIRSEHRRPVHGWLAIFRKPC